MERETAYYSLHVYNLQNHISMEGSGLRFAYKEISILIMTSHNVMDHVLYMTSNMDHMVCISIVSKEECTFHYLSHHTSLHCTCSSRKSGGGL